VSSFTVRRIVEELAARDLTVDARTVHHWLAGDIAPRPARALVLVQISGGRLSLTDVFEHRELVRARSVSDGRATRSEPVGGRRSPSHGRCRGA
jgi:hypothetical protein